jgi:HEPN domain-containing protein
MENNKREAERWVVTARDDLDTAVILKERGKFAHSCFHAQQAGEKAVKAVWYMADADPWGHSIKKLIDDLEQIDLDSFNVLKVLIRPGMILDRYYIPTRYPNGLPDLTPEMAFIDEDAQICLEYARLIVEKVETVLGL